MGDTAVDSFTRKHLIRKSSSYARAGTAVFLQIPPELNTATALALSRGIVSPVRLNIAIQSCTILALLFLAHFNDAAPHKLENIL